MASIKAAGNVSSDDLEDQTRHTLHPDVLLTSGTRRTLLESTKLTPLAIARGRLTAARPFLGQAASSVAGPAIIVGLFSGEGMHGAKDAPRLTAELCRDKIVFAGATGGVPRIEDLLARSIGEALLRDIRYRNSSVNFDTNDNDFGTPL